MRFRLSTLVAAAAAVLTWGASTAAHAQEKFTFLTNWYAIAEHGGFYQAITQGLYKKAGLDVTLKMGGPQVNGMQILEECLEQETAYTWHVWEKRPRGWRTELVAKPTEVGYDATIDYGFDLPAPVTDVFDSVHVTGTSPGGRPVSTERTQSIPALADAGIARAASISLDEPFTTEAANAKGDGFLADHRQPPGAGTVTLAAPVLDRATGRMVHPWQIRSGRLIRLRQPRPRLAGADPTAVDGASIFRLVSTSYDSASNTATCELDRPTYTERRALADLIQRSKKGRR